MSAASFSLGPAAASDGFRVEAHDTVGSTNTLALQRARDGDAGRLWIVSEQQTEGRGRRGRVWEAPRGNLSATLLVTMPAADLPRAATLGFVAGLSLSDALRSVAPQVQVGVAPDGGDGPRGTRFELKWPNDVLAGGAKLAGILLESTLLPNGRAAIAIGIGVNIVAPPSGLPYPATSLVECGCNVTAPRLFAALTDAWAANVRIWAGASGLAAIRSLWLSRAAGLGSDVAVRLDGRVVRGVFETIDDDCRFVVRGADGGVTTIAAGDVHFGAVASMSAA